MKEKDFFKKLADVHNIELTKQQYNPIIRTEGYNLLLACPGSGKTTVIIVKTAYLINVLGVLPHQIITLTFTKAAALDMQKRYKSIFGDSSTMPFFSTIHGFCYRVMKDYFKTQGIIKKNIEEVANKNGFKDKVISQIYKRYFNKKPLDEHIEEIINAISYIKNLMLDINNPKTKQLLNIKYLKKIYEEYELYKEQNNYYDYDDMLSITYNILLKDNRLLDKIRKQFKYIQIDEAQDNSKIQNEIIRLLVYEENNLFMVADDDQTIYEWRGAYPDGVLNFSKQYLNSNIYKMELNFRSSKDIVDISNIFIKNNKLRYDKNLITRNPSNKIIEILYKNPNENQYDYAINIIKKNNISENFAFLYRNNISAAIIGYKLNKAGIDYSIKGSLGHIFDHWIINDILNYLLFSLKGELIYFEQIYYKNNMFITKEKFETEKKGIEHGKNLINNIYNNSNLKKLKKKIKKLSKIPISKAIPFILNEIGYEYWVKYAHENLRRSIEGAKNIINILEYISIDSKDIYDFIEKIKNLDEKFKASKSNDNTYITLSTIHGSKGLEFDTVFIIDLDYGVIPSIDAFDNLKKTERERRLFYVGMTRAKNNLYLMSSTNIKEKTSIFVHEIEEIIDNIYSN